MKVEQFFRKSFPVEAVRVTAENMEEVATWCDGNIREEVVDPRDNIPQPYIKVKVDKPLNERQTKAFVGDWVLYAGKGYKVYKDAGFRKSFDRSDVIPDEKNVFTLNPPSMDNAIIASANIPDVIARGGSGGSGNPGGTHVV